MLEHGAMFGPLVLDGHEYYRLLTAVFMHFGINHIVNNMLVLFVLGDNLERALGKIKYLLFYLLCGVGANAVSMLFDMGQQTHAVSVGASGAIFGVIGGLLYAVLVNRGRLEDLSSSQLIIMIIFPCILVLQVRVSITWLMWPVWLSELCWRCCCIESRKHTVLLNIGKYNKH